jgi:hypothetical protein
VVDPNQHQIDLHPERRIRQVRLESAVDRVPREIGDVGRCVIIVRRICIHGVEQVRIVERRNGLRRDRSINARGAHHPHVVSRQPQRAGLAELLLEQCDLRRIDNRLPLQPQQVVARREGRLEVAVFAEVQFLFIRRRSQSGVEEREVGATAVGSSSNRRRCAIGVLGASANR